jgi:hypothetical protein
LESSSVSATAPQVPEFSLFRLCRGEAVLRSGAAHEALDGRQLDRPPEPDRHRDVDGEVHPLGPRQFAYQTASDSDATIVGAGYFSDGVLKGMRTGDVVDVIATTGPKYKRYQVASVSGDAATVAAPTAIT